MRERFAVKGEDYEPHGLACPLCHRELKDGDIAASIFDGIAENPKHLTDSDESHLPIMLIVCDACADRDDLHEAIAALK